MSDPVELSSASPDQLVVGQQVLMKIRGAEEAAYIPADTVMVFLVGPTTELVFVVNQSSDIQNVMTVKENDALGRITFDNLTTTSKMQSKATARVRLDGESALTLTNNLINHIRNHMPNLADRLAK